MTAADCGVRGAAAKQFQLDVYGGIMDAQHLARKSGLKRDDPSWTLQLEPLRFVEAEAHWTEPDECIWEVRGESKHFTHSKLMTRVAVDRCVKAVEEFGVKDPG